MKPIHVDIHVLQTLPPSNINRDDTGSPKTAVYGNVTRARVSSQAWKAACRRAFPALLDTDRIGKRTKDLVGYVTDFVRQNMPDAEEEDVIKAVTTVIKASGIKVDKDGKTGALFFISPLEAKKLAELAHRSLAGDEKVNAKDAKAILNVRENPTLKAVDVALFGRMVADAPDLNVDAAVQVAHALSVGEALTEYDYYTAMDERSPDDNAGAGMIGTIDFISSTLYRYATIDVRHLAENLGDANVAAEAIRAFITAFCLSMPSGKQNSFAARTLPAAILIQLRDAQPVSLADAFAVPVRTRVDESVMELACKRLVKRERELDQAFGISAHKTYAVIASSDAAPLRELTGSSSTMSLAATVDALVADTNKLLAEGDA